MNTDEELQVMEAMKKYGGSFVKALAECYNSADSINREKIRVTFCGYWDDYRNKAKWLVKK